MAQRSTRFDCDLVRITKQEPILIRILEAQVSGRVESLVSVAVEIPTDTIG